MEEDNADDIIKWLFKDTTKFDCKGCVEMGIEEGARQFRWEAILKGNLLALRPVEIVTQPILFVCEKLDIHQDGNSLKLKQNNKELLITFADENELEKWLLKLNTCSHRIAQADYDQILSSHFTCKSNVVGVPTSFSYFLVSEIMKKLSFSLVQSAIMPNKQITCSEAMYETKLSMLLPIEMVKMSLKWTTELRDDLLDKLWKVKNSIMVDTLHNSIRHLNSNIEIHTTASEFLDSYNGPYFRSSVEKYRVSFLYVPTNLHVQLFSIDERRAASFITAGALAALPLRFTNGGLYKLKNKFVENLTPSSIDYCNESRFQARRQTLIVLKRRIGDLSRRIDVAGHSDDDGPANKAMVELCSEAKQIRATITDYISSFPNISNLVDSLCDGGIAQMQHKSGEAVPRDTLASQMDFLDAQFQSMDTKVAVLAVEKPKQENKDQIDNLNENVRSSFHSALDALHHLTLSLEHAQMLSLIHCLRNKNDCQLFFHLQLRHDALLSQALTITVTALLTAVYTMDSDMLARWDHSDPLLLNFAFLSCFGDEQGMIEDAHEIWQLLPQIAKFRFVPTSSRVTQTYIPQIDGFRTDVRVSIPLNPDKLKELPGKLSASEWFCPKIVFFNLGINHEASLASSIGDISLEENVNRTALKQITEHVLTSQSACGDLGNWELINRLLAGLQQTVATNASKKNTAIFTLAMELNAALGGMCVLSCKSGKDRTSMAVTLEEGRVLKETCGISVNQQVQEIVECLRKNGIRRENCRKNIGKPLYSFSPFQMNFLPKEFRPPLGTFTNMVAS